MAGKTKQDYDKRDIAIGIALKHFRTMPQRDLKQLEIAEHFNKSLSWYNDIERGKTALSWKDVLELCDFMKIDIAELSDYTRMLLEKGK